jgi:hypothetical protein
MGLNLAASTISYYIGENKEILTKNFIGTQELKDAG